MKNDSRRIPRVNISERDFLLIVGGQLYAQAPNHEPRKIDVIMNKIKDKFGEYSVSLGESRFINVPKTEVDEVFRKILFSIPEFEELNLSHVEYHTGVKVADTRPSYMLTFINDTLDWKHDFIDLDAFIGNVERLFWILHDAESDCFGCSRYKSKQCNYCSRNKDLKDYYKSMNRVPRKEGEKVCKYDCIEGCYICCESCKKQHECPHKCEKCSETCECLVNTKKDEN